MMPHQEDDHIPTRGVLLALGATIVLTVVCVVWVKVIMPPLGHTPPTPTPSGPPAVDRTLYTEGPGYSATLRDDKRALLGRWSWVDQKKGVVRMPIEQAMKLVAEGKARP